MQITGALRTTHPLVAACLRCAGDAHEIGRAFLEVADWLKERELPTKAWIGVFEDTVRSGTWVDPHTGRMSGEVRIPFEGDARGDGRIEVRSFEAQTVASALHHGELSTIGATVRGLRDWLRSQGLRGATHHMQIYMKSGPEWETEVQIPVLP